MSGTHWAKQWSETFVHFYPSVCQSPLTFYLIMINQWGHITEAKEYLWLRNKHLVSRMVVRIPGHHYARNHQKAFWEYLQYSKSILLLILDEQTKPEYAEM